MMIRNFKALGLALVAIFAMGTFWQAVLYLHLLSMAFFVGVLMVFVGAGTASGIGMSGW